MIQIGIAVGKQEGMYDLANMPRQVAGEIMATIDAIDRVLPGVRQVLEASELKIIYDPDNRHGIFDEGEDDDCQGYYLWHIHTMYLGDTGISHSIAHEIAHVLDTLAGPTSAEVEEWLAGGPLDSMCTYSVRWFFPSTGRFDFYVADLPKDDLQRRFQEEFDPTNFVRWLVARAILEATLAREDKSIYTGVLLNQILRGSIYVFSQSRFIVERVAHLFEAWVYVWQVDHKEPSRGVYPPSADVYSGGIYWGDSWIREKNGAIRRMFQEMLEVIGVSDNGQPSQHLVAKMQDRAVYLKTKQARTLLAR